MGHSAAAISSDAWDDACPPTSVERTKVIVAGGQPLFRSALCWTLFRAYPHMVVDEAADLRSLFARGHDGSEIALVLILGETFAAGADNEISRLADDVGAHRLIILRDEDEAASTCAPPSRIAASVLSKSLPLAEIAAAVDRVLKANAAFSAWPNTRASPAACERAPLTPAQERVLAAAASGLLNKQIAHEIGITETTVKAHMSAIFRRLGVQNRTQAINLVRWNATVETAGERCAACARATHRLVTPVRAIASRFDHH